MEKKGDMLNQLAIIADLMEKVNVEYINSTIIFNVNEKEFENVYNYTVRRHGEDFIPLKPDVKDFSLVIGGVKVVFNKNNV